jgi:HEAT repeat protein
MSWKRLLRWFAVVLLLGAAMAGFVIVQWFSYDVGNWNWRNRDEAIVGRALGLKISNSDEAYDVVSHLRWNSEAAARGQGGKDGVCVERVLPLLSHSDPKVQAAAANILFHADRALKPGHLAALIAAHRNGLPVLYYIAAIGTPDAVEYVYAALNKSGSEQDLCRMLTAGGPAGIKRMAAIYREDAPVDPELHRAICVEFHRFPSEESRRLAIPIAVEAWLDVARGAKNTPHNRVLAIEVLGLIGDVSTAAVPALRELAAGSPPVVAERARQAIAQIEGGGTMARYLPDLEFEITQEPGLALHNMTLQRIAALGPQGRAAGPLAIRLLDPKNCDRAIVWDLRVEAVKLLGVTGYAEATPRLIATLENEDDWVLAGAAAEALARLGASEAIPALQGVADGYWYPPVRALAAESVNVLRGAARFQEFKRPSAYYGRAGGTALERHIREFRERRLSASRATLLGRRASQLVSNAWERSWQWRYDSIALESGLKASRPDCGQGFGDGFLLGYDSGEFGGQIDYVVAGKIVKEFRPGRVLGFYRMPFGVVVVAAWWPLHECMLYVLRPGPDGVPTCEPFKRLPTAAHPFSHPRLVPIGRCWNGDLLIGGDVILTRSGHLRLAD